MQQNCSRENWANFFSCPVIGTFPKNIQNIEHYHAVVPKNIFKMWEIFFLWNIAHHLFMVNVCVLRQSVSCLKCLTTKITRNRNSFQMICLNVNSYYIPSALLPTHFANVQCFLPECSIWPFASWDHPLAFLHHWLPLLTKRWQVCSWLVWDC